MAPRPSNPATSRDLVRAMTELVLTQGYEATSIAEICDHAGVTKGAFFHYFPNKEAIALEALRTWIQSGMEAYSDAPFLGKSDPVERVAGYSGHTARLHEQSPIKGCLIGQFTQEVYSSNPSLRAVCGEAFTAWADGVTQMAWAALGGGPETERLAADIGINFVALYEGALIFSRATGRDVVGRQLEMFSEHVAMLVRDRVDGYESEGATDDDSAT